MSEFLTDPITDVAPVESPIAPNVNMSLEALILLITTERLKSLKDKTRAELTELKGRQDKVRKIHEALRTINTETDDKGKLDFSSNQELKDLLNDVKELGITIKDDKFTYTKEERDRLVENLRTAAEDFNVENEMQIQTISRFTNERYETYQMARSILRPLHEDKQRKAREISGGR
jgi:hypothetical protein